MIAMQNRILLLAMTVSGASLSAQDGALDLSFDPGSGANYEVVALAPQPDGRILVGGLFGGFGGSAENFLVRLNEDGSMDGSFGLGAGPNGFVSTIVVMPDEKILVGGDFEAYDGQQHQNIARLHADGSVDNDFSGAAGNVVTACLPQPDGKVVLAGWFGPHYITRLNSDGSVDPSFDVGSGADNYITSAVLQPDGKIIIVGGFLSVNGIARGGVARLNVDGTLDLGFSQGDGAVGPVENVALQADGKVLICGGFISYDGVPSPLMARLHNDGSLDSGFVPQDAPGGVRCMLPLPDGKIIIGGGFTTYGTTPQNRIARLHPDGVLDGSFGPGAGADGIVGTAVLQPDGRILIGGNFTSYDNITRNRLARILNDGTTAVVDQEEESLLVRWDNADGSLLIRPVRSGSYQVNVTDMCGRLIDRHQVFLAKDLDHRLSISERSAAAYFVIVLGGGVTSTTKVIKPGH